MTWLLGSWIVVRVLIGKKDSMMGESSNGTGISRRLRYFDKRMIRGEYISLERTVNQSIMRLKQR